MILIAVSLAGVALFLWPFLAAGAPSTAAAASLAFGTVAAFAAVEVLTRRIDSRRFALLAAIAALDAALRLILVNGIGGFSPIFFLILVAGYVFGPSFGFLCGAISLLASALVTGGIGPWLPYQVFACGWVGAIAGVAGQFRRGVYGWRDLVVLGAVAVVTGYAFGALLDVWDWTTFYRGAPGYGFVAGASPGELAGRFAAFYFATSAAWDSFRAFGDVIAVLVLGLPFLTALDRIRSRFSFTTEPVVVV